MRSRCRTRCRPGRIGATAGICATCCWAGGRRLSAYAADDAHFQPQGQLTVHCSPARKVLLTGCVPGAEVIQGEALTQCSLPLTLFKARGYCRVTVEDAAGGRAWSNPIQLRC